jgi:hypothetical protein
MMASELKLKLKAQSAFMQQFQLEKRVLLPADKRRGSAALRGAQDVDDVPVLIKTWPRVIGHDDSDLREIWRNEIRQLHRLAGHPTASDYIVELRTAHEDESGFHLVLNPGERRPLDKFFGEADASGRREVPRELRDRRLVWANLRRIANGLELLHSQGLLHRNLSTWSVLTNGRGEVDFQLTGFEWSMRLASSDGRPGTKKSSSRPSSSDSFIRDWQDFGELAVQLLGIGTKIKNRAIANHEVSDAFSADEIRLLRKLLQIVPTELVDGGFVIGQIDEVLLTVDAQAKGREPRFNLILTLGQNSDLGRKIREASDGEVEIDDVQAQKAFVEADLFTPKLLSERVLNHPGAFTLVLRGQHLSYQLQDFRFGPEKTPSNWDAASCTRASVTVPLAHNIISSVPLSRQAINFMTITEMKGSTARSRERFTSWEELRSRLRPETETASKERELRKSFALMQLLEYLFSAVELFPVQIVAQPPVHDSSNPQDTLVLRPRVDDNREKLSSALGLREPLADRLAKALQEDRVEHDGSKVQNWKLTDSSILGGRPSTTTEWKFKCVTTADDGELQFTFTGDRSAPNIEDAFLISDDSVGTHEQFKRRMRSFKALAEHGELTRMLVDPRSRILHNDERVAEFPQFFELDSSKQEAFKAAVETVPLFLIQGPPGVGKTRLVKELVRYSLSTENSSRLLLSAQSNHAVDHLLHEIEEIGIVSPDTTTLIVRCQARERKDEKSQFDISQQAKRLIKDVRDSELYKGASPHLRKQVDSLSESFGWNDEKWSSGGQGAKSSRRALEGLVLRAANLVFATTNSGDLGRLIDEKAQFDWTIIEEAGKATGGELISPLLLSHRRLMIGDHKQLPPFGAERILAMLEKPKAVKGALQRGDSLIGRAFRDSTIDEIFLDIDSEESAQGDISFANLCTQATKMFSLFETIIENEFERQRSKKSGRPIAKPLTSQHRMHPSIAKIVSNAFYAEQLVTDPDRAAKFAAAVSPIGSTDLARLPDSPVVWIDMPWVQNTMHMKKGEEQPRYVNELELAAVQSILGLLTVNAQEKSKPSLAILSPYSRQVLRLNRLTEDGGKCTSTLEKFSRASKQKTFCSTVDSFQGSEADCIIISLVRNNHLGTLSAALGFLADARRMNVLLSRARWKLVVIGSLDFLESVLKIPKSPADVIKIEFLAKIFADIKPKTANPDVRVIPFDVLRGMKK